jgi:hypothetical protein
MQVAGADVWKGRWVVVVLDDGRFTRAFVAPTIEEAVAELADVAAIGIDMPIGLPAAGTRRPADLAAREFVGKRRNSVFFTPSPSCWRRQRPPRRTRWPGLSGGRGSPPRPSRSRSSSWPSSPWPRPMSGSGRCIPRSPSPRPMAVSRSNGRRPAGTGPRCAHASSSRTASPCLRTWGPPVPPLSPTCWTLPQPHHLVDVRHYIIEHLLRLLSERNMSCFGSLLPTSHLPSEANPALAASSAAVIVALIAGAIAEYALRRLSRSHSIDFSSRSSLC